MIHLLLEPGDPTDYYDFIDSDTLISSNYAHTELTDIITLVSTYLADTSVDISTDGPFYSLRPDNSGFNSLKSVADTGLSNSDYTVLYSFEPSDFHLFLDQYPELFL